MEKRSSTRNTLKYLSTSLLDRTSSRLHKAADLAYSLYGHAFAIAATIIAAYQPLAFYAQYPLYPHLLLSTINVNFLVNAVGNAYVTLTEKNRFDQLKSAILGIKFRLGYKSRSMVFFPSVLGFVAVDLGITIVDFFFTMKTNCFDENYIYPFCLSVVFWHLLNVYRILAIANYCMWVNINRNTFVLMRKHLLNYFPQNSNIPTLQTYMHDYDLLIEFSRKAQSYFRVNNSCIIVRTFEGLITVVFFGGVLYKGAIPLPSILAGIVTLLAPVVLLIWTCANCVDEAEKFNEALASLCIRDKTGTLVKNPYVTAHFAIGKKLKFSACGCFNIDYRLGYSMLAACITYLVILVEFDNKKDVIESQSPTLIATSPLPT